MACEATAALRSGVVRGANHDFVGAFSATPERLRLNSVAGADSMRPSCHAHFGDPLLQIAEMYGSVPTVPVAAESAHRSYFDGFRPMLGLANGDLQTLVAHLWPTPRESFESVHHRIRLPDGDLLDVAWSEPAVRHQSRAVVVLVHGLAGCYRSRYMVRIAARLLDAGFGVLRVNLRGCGTGVGLARRPYHAGCSDDIRAVCDWLRHHCDWSSLVLAGFSLGGNMVLKLAGESEASVPGLVGVVAACPPIDLQACSRRISQRRNRIYERYFVTRLHATVVELAQRFPDLPPVRFPRRVSLREFDNLYTAPRAGFRDVDDYYDRSHALPWVPRIRVPTLIVAAADDPFVVAEPILNLPHSESLDVRVTRHGGHMGFLGRSAARETVHWLDGQVCNWIQQLCESKLRGRDESMGWLR